MKNMVIVLTLALGAAGCTTTERDAVTGGVVGAAVGGLATGEAAGAVVGGAVGAAAGVLLGRATRQGECRYRDRRGNIYIDRCPRGY